MIGAVLAVCHFIGRLARVSIGFQRAFEDLSVALWQEEYGSLQTVYLGS
jgi:hypothetical protein